MKEIGRWTSDKVVGSNAIPMGTLIMASSGWVRPMEKVCIHGIMEKSMMESGIVVSNMVMAFGKVFMVTLILENGDTQKQRGMECIIGRMEIDMKVSGSNV